MESSIQASEIWRSSRRNFNGKFRKVRILLGLFPKLRTICGIYLDPKSTQHIAQNLKKSQLLYILLHGVSEEAEPSNRRWMGPLGYIHSVEALLLGRSLAGFAGGSVHRHENPASCFFKSLTPGIQESVESQCKPFVLAPSGMAPVNPHPGEDPRRRPVSILNSSTPTVYSIEP